ncbi:hypothetical protein D3C77_310810 [compost metagenome]
MSAPLIDFPQQRHFRLVGTRLRRIALHNIPIGLLEYPHFRAAQSFRFGKPGFILNPLLLEHNRPYFMDQRIVTVESPMQNTGIIELNPGEIGKSAPGEFQQIDNARLFIQHQIIH